MPFLYILRCADLSLYIGVTNSLDDRMARHADGRGGAYTVKRRPIRLVYVEEFQVMASARNRERQLKGWTRQKKEALIAGDRAQLRGISARRRRRS